MADKTSIVNLALQTFGSRTNVTALELANNSSNEAIQANLAYDSTRDELLRMAPWDCAFFYRNLIYITSTPGTPENTSAATVNWQPGQPPPPWSYEYQYPVDCLRACWLIPATQTGFSSDVPVTTAVTGGTPAFWNGPPQKFRIATDLFYPVTAATVAVGGTGYAVGDEITLAQAAQGVAPVGAPVVLRVLTAPAGVVATVEVVNQIINSATPLGGSYFRVQSNPVAQGSVAGVGGSTSAGTGATFNLTFGTRAAQRVILTNQQNATLAFVRQVTDPNVMDTLFLNAWKAYLGAKLIMALTGDKKLVTMQANQGILSANEAIKEARKADGNEGLTVNDVVPDWIRGRGIAYPPYGTTPWAGYDWGVYLPVWG